MKPFSRLVLSFFLFSSFLFAESSTEVVPGMGQRSPAPEQSEKSAEGLAAEETVLGFGGWIDLRPGWYGADNSASAENEAALQYTLGKNRAVGYTQEFSNSFFSNSNPGTGFGLTMGDGYLWGQATELFKVPGLPITVDYEPRVYLPTLGEARYQSFMLSTRQYLKAKWQATNNLAFFIWEAPVFSWYRDRGFEQDGAMYANHFYENRIETGLQLGFFEDRLRIRLPIIWQAFANYDFDATAWNNGRWTSDVWLSPEVVYDIGTATTVGVAYYSDTIAGDEEERTSNFNTGLHDGVVQAVIQQTF